MLPLLSLHQGDPELHYIAQGLKDLILVNSQTGRSPKGTLQNGKDVRFVELEHKKVKSFMLTNPFERFSFPGPSTQKSLREERSVYLLFPRSNLQNFILIRVTTVIPKCPLQPHLRNSKRRSRWRPRWALLKYSPGYLRRQTKEKKMKINECGRGIEY